MIGPISRMNLEIKALERLKDALEGRIALQREEKQEIVLHLQKMILRKTGARDAAEKIGAK